MSTKRLTLQMNGNIENLACKSAELQSQPATKLDVCEELLKIHSEKSIVQGLQLYSDKYQATIAGNGVMFYSSQVTIFNFSEEWRKAHIP